VFSETFVVFERSAFHYIPEDKPFLTTAVGTSNVIETQCAVGRSQISLLDSRTRRRKKTVCRFGTSTV
jgi:hypothetical protein